MEGMTLLTFFVLAVFVGFEVVSKVSTTLDLYVGEFDKRKVNDSGQRLAEVYAGGLRQS